MSDYHPDKWVGVKISGYEDSPPIYKIFACWYGGYAGSDSWKLNSGITKATLVENHFEFEGSSGSVYFCGKDNYGTSGYGFSVLSGMIDKSSQRGITIEILPEETNWLELNYE